MLLLERERRAWQQTQDTSPASVPLYFLDHRYRIDPDLPSGERATQRLHVFLAQVEQLLAEDLAELTEPIQDAFACAENQEQRERVAAVQQLASVLQEQTQHTFVTMHACLGGTVSTDLLDRGTASDASRLKAAVPREEREAERRIAP